MIEDQVAPKRCGHTKGKSVIGREEAYARVQAAVDARNEGVHAGLGRYSMATHEPELSLLLSLLWFVETVAIVRRIIYLYRYGF